MKDKLDAFRIGVPITPWGIRQSIATADDPELQGVQIDGIHYYMQKLLPDEIPQEWRDTWQQCFEQQMSVAQELLNRQNIQLQGQSQF